MQDRKGPREWGDARGEGTKRLDGSEASSPREWEDDVGATWASVVWRNKFGTEAAAFGLEWTWGLAGHRDRHAPPPRPQAFANEERGLKGEARVEREIWEPPIRGDHLNSYNSEIRKGTEAKNKTGSTNPWGTRRPAWLGDRSSHFMRHTQASLYMHFLQRTSPTARTAGLH